MCFYEINEINLHIKLARINLNYKKIKIKLNRLILR